MNGFWVYTITSPDGMIYVGMSGQKDSWRRLGESNYKNTSLKYYIELFGWDNLEKNIVKECLTREEAMKLEGELIVFCELNGVNINEHPSGGLWSKLGEKEYGKIFYQEHKEEYALKSKKYREEHKEEDKERHKNYYLDNRERFKNKQIEYYKKHKEEIKEYQRRYRERKKLEKQFKEQGYLPLF